MVDLEKLSTTAMELISYGGCAKSMYMEALKLAKVFKFKEAVEKIHEADQMMAKAHHLHVQLLTLEANENVAQVSLMMVHAEDQLMNCETVKLLVTELMEIYEEKGEQYGKKNV